MELMLIIDALLLLLLLAMLGVQLYLLGFENGECAGRRNQRAEDRRQKSERSEKEGE